MFIWRTGRGCSCPIINRRHRSRHSAAGGGQKCPDVLAVGMATPDRSLKEVRSVSVPHQSRLQSTSSLPLRPPPIVRDDDHVGVIPLPRSPPFDDLCLQWSAADIAGTELVPVVATALADDEVPDLAGKRGERRCIDCGVCSSTTIDSCGSQQQHMHDEPKDRQESEIQRRRPTTLVPGGDLSSESDRLWAPRWRPAPKRALGAGSNANQVHPRRLGVQVDAPGCQQGSDRTMAAAS